jgi:outer membrane protein assembly factor BamB
MKKTKKHLFTHFFLLSILMLSASDISGQALEFVTSFGQDQLGDPDDEDCMVAGNGLLFIQDDSEDQIEVFNASAPFAFVQSFGAVELSSPAEGGIEIDNNFIFIMDDGDNEIEVYNATSPFGHVATFGTVNPGGAAAGEGKLFVSDPFNDAIQVYSTSSPFSLLTTITNSNVTGPSASVVYNGILFVTDRDSDNVHLFNVTDYSYLGEIGETEISSAEEGITAGDGYIFVLDNNEVEIFNATAPFDHVMTVDVSTETNAAECIAYFDGLVFIADNAGADEIDVYRCVLDKDQDVQNLPALPLRGLILLGMCIMLIGGILIRQ